jgi:hypothetical protein
MTYVDREWLDKNIHDILLPSIGKAVRDDIDAAVRPLKEQIAELQLTLEQFGFRGDWEPGVEFKRGNFVMLSGSLWHCNADNTTSRPDTHNPDWKIAVKRGRDAPRAEPRSPTRPRMLSHNR